MKILIAIPCADLLDVNFVESLTLLQTPEGTDIKFVASSLIYDARNKLASMAIENGYDYVMWFDSDMTFEPDLLIRLLDDIKDKDMVTGLYFNRRPPFRPTVFEECDISQKDREIRVSAVHQKHIPDSMFEIAACGFGCILVRTSVFKEVYEKQGLPFSPLLGLGEDLSFCWRARQQGFKVWCDPKLLCGHTAHIVVGDETYIESWNQQSHD